MSARPIRDGGSRGSARIFRIICVIGATVARSVRGDVEFWTSPMRMFTLADMRCGHLSISALTGSAANLAPKIRRKYAMQTPLEEPRLKLCSNAVPPVALSTKPAPPLPPGDGRVAHFIRDGALSLVFQPIVSLETGAVVAFEALGRPKRGFDSVEELFAVAERERSVPSLDHFAHSLAVASGEYLAGDSRLFINASPVTMASPGFADRLGRLAAHAAFPVERVVVELTEAEGEDEHDGVAASVHRLRALGFGFAIDDVGIGRSDLSRILKYRPDWIKLDRSLVQSLTADPYSRSLVGALAAFASERSIGLIAEGIELPSQARAVAELGITLAQGYWFAWPLALGEAASARCPQRVERRWRATNLAA